MFSIVFNGDIADIVNDASNLYQDLTYKMENSILEISGSSDIDIYSSTDVSNISSTISSNISSEKTILNITILVKKGILSQNIKTTIIKINEKVLNYNLAIITKGNTSIYKYIKQTKLNLIQKLEDNSSLYKANDCLLLNIDCSGFIKCYLDTENIYNVKDDNDITKFIESENITKIKNKDINNTPINNDPINDPIKLLDLCNYKKIDLSLSDNSYNLNLIYIEQEIESDAINISSLDLQISKIQPIQQQSSATSNTSYSSIGYVMSWLNPFYYYSSTSNTNSNATSNITITSTELESSHVIINKNEKLQNEISYFANKNTIAKLYNNNKIKILKPILLNVPTHIQNINFDENNKITFQGRICDNINKKYYNVDISFNEFMINKNVEIVITQ